MRGALLLLSMVFCSCTYKNLTVSPRGLTEDAAAAPMTLEGQRDALRERDWVEEGVSLEYKIRFGGE